jgi:DNA-binding MarR family transcriptional regulator
MEGVLNRPYQRLVPRYDARSARCSETLEFRPAHDFGEGEGGAQVTQYSAESEPERHLPLHEKVSRILHGLARSSLTKSAPDGNGLAVSEELVKTAIRAWRERACYLPAELLSDPAWGMLLELLHAEISKRRVTVARLCKASAASTPSALRWLKALEDRELVVRQADPPNSENEFVELSPRGSTALRLYFRDNVQ